jgi:hypothetical protein
MDFYNFMEISVVIPSAAVFVMTDLPFVFILCKFRLPLKQSDCLLLALQVALDYLPPCWPTFSSSVHLLKTVMHYGQIASPVMLHLLTIFLLWL